MTEPATQTIDPELGSVLAPIASVLSTPAPAAPIPKKSTSPPASTKPLSKPTSAAASSTASKAAPKSVKKEKIEKSKSDEVIEYSDKATRATRNSIKPISKAKSVKELSSSEDEVENEEEEEEEDGGVTRCVCGIESEEAAAQLMIQCDSCKCWQHGPCVGLWLDKDCPARYFCEQCKPGWHGPGGLLRKAHRKSVAPPPPTTHNYPTRSPSVPRNKPRESADAALVSAFLAADQSVNATVEAEKSEEESVEPVIPPVRHRRSISVTSNGPTKGAPVEDGKAPKKRSTMNSRDAAYDDAIAMSILGPGSAAMRARLEKATNGEESSEEEDNKSEEDSRKKVPVQRAGSASSITGDAIEKESEDDYTVVPSPPAKKRRRITKEVATEPESTEEQDLDQNHDGSDHGEDQTMREGDITGDLDGSQHEDEEHDMHVEGVPARAKHPNQYTYRPKPAVTRGRGSPTRRTNTHQNGNASASSSHLSAYDHPSYKGKNSHKEWATFDSSWGVPEHFRHLSNLLPTKAPIPLAVPTYQSTLIEEINEAEEIQFETHLESSTKIKFPNKRITMPEMKKRSRVVLEFIARIQVESGEKTGSKDGETSKMMEKLTKDVLHFQQRYFGSTD